MTFCTCGSKHKIPNKSEITSPVKKPKLCVHLLETIEMQVTETSEPKKLNELTVRYKDISHRLSLEDLKRVQSLNRKYLKELLEIFDINHDKDMYKPIIILW